MQESVYVSEIQPGDRMEGSTVAAVYTLADGRRVIELADGRSTVPMRGDHRYRVTRA